MNDGQGEGKQSQVAHPISPEGAAEKRSEAIEGNGRTGIERGLQGPRPPRLPPSTLGVNQLAIVLL